MVALAAAGALSLCLTATGGSTYAAFSDFAVVHASASAGVWAPDPPGECGDLTRYDSVLYGTPGDDTLVGAKGGNQRQIIMGYGGNDTLIGGNGGDCLVGGDGDDQLYGGNAKDILIGGAGDDLLDGGNGKDNGNGGEGADVCDGGRGKNTIVNCEKAPDAALAEPLTAGVDTQLAAPHTSTSPNAPESAVTADETVQPDVSSADVSQMSGTTSSSSPTSGFDSSQETSSESPADPTSSGSNDGPDSEQPVSGADLDGPDVESRCREP